MQSVLFAPIAALYAFVVWVRNTLYEHHLLRSHTVSVPTICVGNLAVGGTGKTPHVEWLIRFLQPRYKVAVLSRGYKRHTKGFLIADARSTANEIGDECMQIHRKFPNVVVAVSEDRVSGIKQLQQLHPEVQVVLLDDAFQHRRLTCGFYILLTNADNLYVHDHFLPWGSLRDNVHESLRANVIVVTKCPKTMTAIERRTIVHELKTPAYQQLLFSSVDYADWRDNVAALPPTAKVLVVTGIAHPEYLMQHVTQRFPDAQLRAYPDHHDFTATEIAALEKEASHFNLILTTEKDLPRLQVHKLTKQLSSKLYPVEIHVNFVDDEPLKHEILRYLTKICKS